MILGQSERGVNHRYRFFFRVQFQQSIRYAGMILDASQICGVAAVIFSTWFSTASTGMRCVPTPAPPGGAIWILYAKKGSVPFRRLTPKRDAAMEVPTRFELVHRGFADLCLTTWLRHRMN